MLNLIFDFDGVIGDTFEEFCEAIVHIGMAPDIDSAQVLSRDYVSKKSPHTRDHTLTNDELGKEYETYKALGLYVSEKGFGLFDNFVSEIEQVNTENKAIVSSNIQSCILPAISNTRINPTHILAFENHHSKEEKIETICQD